MSKRNALSLRRESIKVLSVRTNMRTGMNANPTDNDLCNSAKRTCDCSGGGGGGGGGAGGGGGGGGGGASGTQNSHGIADICAGSGGGILY